MENRDRHEKKCQINIERLFFTLIELSVSGIGELRKIILKINMDRSGFWT